MTLQFLAIVIPFHFTSYVWLFSEKYAVLLIIFHTIAGVTSQNKQNNHYRQISTMRPTKFPNINVSPVVFHLSLPNTVLSGEWRCSCSSADRRCFCYIWVINKFVADRTQVGPMLAPWTLLSKVFTTTAYNRTDNDCVNKSIDVQIYGCWKLAF